MIGPLDRVDEAFRKWLVDHPAIERIEYCNPFINEFGFPRRFGEVKHQTPYTGAVKTITRE